MTRFKLGDVLVTRKRVYFPVLGTDIEVGAEWPVVVLAPESGDLDPDTPDLRVAPISLHVEMASDRDLLCAADDGPLGVPFFVELWNQRPMFVRNVDRCIGSLSSEAVDLLCLLHNAIVGAVEWQNVPEHSHGRRIEDRLDPRNAYQRDRLKEAEFLSDPVDELLEAQPQESEAHVYEVGNEWSRALYRSFSVVVRYFDAATAALGHYKYGHCVRETPIGPLQAGYFGYNAIVQAWRDQTGEYMVVPAPHPVRQNTDHDARLFRRVHTVRSPLGFDVRGEVCLYGLRELATPDLLPLLATDEPCDMGAALT